MNPRAFKIIMSKGDPIKIDADELPRVIEALTKKLPCLLKKGILNPSFFVSVIEDQERIGEYWKRFNEIEKDNEMQKRLGHSERSVPQFLLLKDIFEDTALRTNKIIEEIPF